MCFGVEGGRESRTMQTSAEAHGKSGAVHLLLRAAFGTHALVAVSVRGMAGCVATVCFRGWVGSFVEEWTHQI